MKILVDSLPYDRHSVLYYQDNNNGCPHDECKWCQDETSDADDFCSYGERKDKE